MEKEELWEKEQSNDQQRVPDDWELHFGKESTSVLVHCGECLQGTNNCQERRRPKVRITKVLSPKELPVWAERWLWCIDTFFCVAFMECAWNGRCTLCCQPWSWPLLISVAPFPLGHLSIPLVASPPFFDLLDTHLYFKSKICVLFAVVSWVSGPISSP